MKAAFSLGGKVALVIGGTSGIGRAIAGGFLESGARVVVAGRTPAKLARAVEELKSIGERTGAVPTCATWTPCAGLSPPPSRNTAASTSS